YDRWVAMLSGMYAGAGKERVAWNQALTSDMIYTQPVVYEFGLIKSKTLLMIGGKDRTAPGANRAPAEIAARLGNYPELGRRAARTIPMPHWSNSRNSVTRRRWRHRRHFIRRCWRA